MEHLYLTLKNDTTISFSDPLPDETIEVYVKRGEKDKETEKLICVLPGLEVKESSFSKTETESFKALIAALQSAIYRLVGTDEGIPEVLFKILDYNIVLWKEDKKAKTPVCVYAGKTQFARDATCIFISSAHCPFVTENKAHISEEELSVIFTTIDVYVEDILKRWTEVYGEPTYLI